MNESGRTARMPSSPEELAELRDKRAHETVRYCYEQTQFYRAKLDALGVEPDDIRSVDDLERLPILLGKDDERELQERSREELGHPFGEHLAVPVGEVVGVASTSGTTGTPTFYAFTRQDISTTNDNWGRAFAFAGIRPGDTVLHGFGLSMFLAGVPVVRALEDYGARPVPIGAEAGTERLLRMAGLTRPRVLACTPSYATYLVDQAEKVLGISAAELGIEIVFCAGEPGAGLPEVRAKLQNGFGAKVYDMLGGAHGVMCCSCDAEPYAGMHVLGQDTAITTHLVDQETKQPVPLTDGATGERVKTSLWWQAQPQLRASVGDVYQVLTETCSCGRPGQRIRVLGRTDDLLIVKGVKISPAAVKNLVLELVPLASGSFRIVLDAPPPRVEPPLRMVVERGEGVDEAGGEKLAAELERSMHQRLTVRPEIEIVPPNTLERTNLKEQLIERRY
jgi:phenylacetate-CoA ligase